MGVRRAAIIIFNTLVGLIAVAILAGAIYGYVTYSSLSSIMGIYLAIAFGVIIGISAVLLLFSICAIVWSNSQNYCCCVIYCFLATIIGVAFIAAGVLTLKAPRLALGSTCDQKPYFEDVQNFSTLAQLSICSTCPCYFPLSVIQQKYTSSQKLALAPNIPLASSIDPTLPVRIQQCPTFQSPNYTLGFNLFAFMETNLQCTGWCSNTSSLFYRFTNVSNGIPKDTCYSAVTNFAHTASTFVAVPCIIIGGLQLLSMLAFLFLCCMPPPGKELQQTQMPPNTTDEIYPMTTMSPTFNPDPYYPKGSGPYQYSVRKSKF